MSTLALVIVASLVAASFGFNCFIHDNVINYSGFIHTTNFSLCYFDPSRTLEKFSAGGLNDQIDEMKRFITFMDDTGSNSIVNDYLCYEETYHRGLSMESTFVRCVCRQDGCNSYENLPKWAIQPDFGQLELNETISYRKYKHLMYLQSIKRHGKF